MTKIRKFTREAERDYDDYIAYLEQVKAGIQAGTISIALQESLNLNFDRLDDGINLLKALGLSFDISVIYAKALDGDFEGAGLDAAELATAQIIAHGLETLLRDTTDIRIRSALNTSPLAVGAVVGIAANLAADAYVEFSQQVYETLKQTAEDAIDNIPNAQDFISASYTALDPLAKKLNHYIDYSVNIDDYHELIVSAFSLVREYGADIVGDILPNINIFTNPETITTALEDVYHKNSKRVIIDLETIQGGDTSLGLLSPEMEAYSENYLESQQFLNPEFIAEEVLNKIRLHLPNIADLVLTELSTGHTNVRAQDGASFIVLDAFDKGTGSSFDDIILGGNELRGKGGNDILIAKQDATSVLIKGGQGDDHIYGSINDDVLLSGGAGKDTIYGFAGIDTIEGNGGKDILFGGAGEDTISGGNGKDDLFGGDDNDTLFGGNGNDRVFGEEGGDTILINVVDEDEGGDEGENDGENKGDGKDRYDGGNGYDTIDASQSTQPLVFDFDSMFGSGSESDKVLSVEQFIGSENDDQILNWFPAGSDFVGGFEFFGMGGNDTLSVHAGGMTFIGGSGRDELIIDSIDTHTYLLFDMGTDDDGATDTLHIQSGSGSVFVEIYGANSNDRAYSNNTSLAVIIDNVIGDAFEGWHQRDDSDGNTTWEWSWSSIPDTDITSISYTANDSTLHIWTQDATILLENFENGDLGIVIPDNLYGPGVGDVSNQRDLEFEKLIFGKSEFGEIDSAPSRPGEFFIESEEVFSFETTDDWGVFALG